MAPVNHLRVIRPGMPRVSYFISQLIQRLHDDTEGAPLIVAFEVFDILQHKNRWLTSRDNSHHVKKQRSLGFAGKAMRTAHRIFLRDAGKRERLAGEASQQHIMLRDRFTNMPRRLLVANVRALAEGNIADIFIKTVLLRITVPVGLIGAYRVLVPLAGENALSADGFKTTADPTNTGKQIDKTEPIVRMMGRRRRQERRQMSNFLRAQTLRRAAKRRHALEDRRAPVLFADAHQFGNQRFYIVDRHQLTQQRLSVFPGLFSQRQRPVFLA